MEMHDGNEDRGRDGKLGLRLNFSSERVLRQRLTPLGVPVYLTVPGWRGNHRASRSLEVGLLRH